METRNKIAHGSTIYNHETQKFTINKGKSKISEKDDIEINAKLVEKIRNQAEKAMKDLIDIYMTLSIKDRMKTKPKNGL